MKIAVLLGSFSIGARPLDFSCIFTNPRGLTGTELCFIRTGQELEKLGHEVHYYTVFTNPGEWKNLHQASEFPNIDDTFDAIINLNEPNLFIGLKTKAIKIIWMMLNDFSFILPNFDENVDHYFGVCDEHTEHMKKQCPAPDKWSTLALGCDPDLYEQKNIPGRVLWCSSADRGLHWLLSMWPDIKKEIPHASLRVLYHFGYDGVFNVEPNSITPQGGPFHPHIIEMAQRVRYIKNAMEKLKDLDVVHVGSVSREQMVKEWNEASVFGFSADTVAFSEGFSISTLEAHASFTVPVITSVDCLGGIYNDSGCIMIDAPIKNHLNEYKKGIIDALNGINTSDAISKCREFAKNHSWKLCAEKLETFIKENK